MLSAKACLWCAEPVSPEETDPVCLFYHRECQLRSTLGSVGHQLRRCPCYGGDLEDPPELSKRDAARAAVLLHRALAGRPFPLGLPC